MKSIFTVQHTQSIHHTNGMVGSWTDWGLTELGLSQAGKIGEKLGDELAGKKPALYSSDLLRARQTAETIGKLLNVTSVFRQELRERNLGRCCGRSVQWLIEIREMAENTIDDRLFSDAEIRRDEWNRLKPFFDEIMGSRDEQIIIVSHGDLLGVFNTMFLGLEAETLNNSELFGYPGGVSRLLVDNAGRRLVRTLSDLSYLC